MATQQLTQPIVNPIAAFDATQNYTITFLAIGGAQVIGNRIVISNNQTGDIVFDDRVVTMQLSHTIPANTLINGQYYNVVIYTIDSANNFSQASVPVPFYCYSQPTLTITNIPDSTTIENGTYEFQGSYAQQENENLNSYQFILYDSNKTVLSQSDVIYYSSDSSLSYSFVGMSNDTSYYIELRGQTVNNTDITTGLLYFTVRYSQPASFAIVDLVNDCSNGFIQISSNIVAIDGKSNPEPPIYIDNKEVDLRDPDSWVKWDEGFNIKNDFTMRVWGRDFNDFEPIITLLNQNNTDSEPNKIEMKWMVADVMKVLPNYTLVSGKNVGIVNGYKTDISDLSIYGSSEQINKDSVDFGTENSMTINTTNDMYLDIDVYGSHFQNSTTPSPDFPSKIKTVGSNMNILNYNNLTTAAQNAGYVIDENGNVYHQEQVGDTRSWSYSNSNYMLELDKGSYMLSIYFSKQTSNNNSQIVIYKEDNVSVKIRKLNDINNINIDFSLQEAQKIGLMIKTFEGIYKIKLEKGSEATPWSPFGMGSVGIDVSNENLFNEQYIQGYFTNDSGNTNTATDGARADDYIPVSDNKTTYVLFKCLKSCTLARFWLMEFDENYNGIKRTAAGIYDTSFNIGNTIKQLNLSQNCRYIKPSFYGLRDGDATLTYDKFNEYFDISISRNQTEEYIEHQSQTAIMPIQRELLNGDYIADVEHHTWEKIILTGSESWLYDTSNKRFYFTLTDKPNVSLQGLALCTHYKNGNSETTNNEFNIGSTQIFIRDENFNSVSDWKTYLQNQNTAGTPVEVYYKIATSINLELVSEQRTVRNTLINTYDPITNVYASDDLSLLKVSTTPIPSLKITSKIYSSGDKENQLEDLGIINIDYNQGYFETTDTNFVLKPDFVYNLSFDYTVNDTTTDLYFTVSYKSDGEIFDITDASQYINQTTGRNNISFMVPENIPKNSTLSIKFARTIIPADISVTVKNVSLAKGRFIVDYQSPNVYNIYPTVTQKNMFNYEDIYYIRNVNATLTYIQNGFSSEVVTTGEKSFFEFGFPNILQPGNKYAISYNSYGAIKSAKIYTMDKETGETLEQIVTENGVFTAPSNLYDIKAEFILDDSVADNQVQVWNIQLENNEQVTGIAPYVSNNTDLVLNQPLRGIGDYRDLACLESPNILNPETQIAVVKGSTTYSFSQNGTTVYKFDYINEDNNVISSENMASGQFTTPDNCVRIKFDTTSDIITTNKLQVNLGDTVMVYYPYVNEPSIIRYVKELTLTGDEIWSYDNINKVFYTNLIRDTVFRDNSTINVISNQFLGIFDNQWRVIAKERDFLIWSNVSGILDIITKEYTTPEEFKTMLKSKYETGMPIIINYVLSIPIIEPSSSDNILALQNLKTYEGVSNVFTNNNMPANLSFSYISGQSEQETKNVYVTLKCWNGNTVPYFIHSNYIDIPKETDKVFIWLRRKNNIFDLKIENLGDYGEDKPGSKGQPQVAITVNDTTTTTITITANTIDIATLSNVKFSKDNGATWDAEIPLDGLSSTDTYTFTGLQPATTYQVRVEATNVNGITGGITQQVITRAS